ncbi:hypothetical protein ABZP36_018166 [Zizania latifolia]
MATAAAPAAAPAPAAPAALVPRGQVDLVDFIDWRHVECLNQDSSHTVINALKQGYRDDEGLYLASDSGEQLLIHIPFTQVVKLHSSLFKGPEEEGPKIIKLFTNKEHMGFSNVGDYPPSDSLNLSSNHLVGNKLVHLKYVKFQNVCRYMHFSLTHRSVPCMCKPACFLVMTLSPHSSLIIFIEHNQSKSDVSKIQKIVLFGSM